MVSKESQIESVRGKEIPDDDHENFKLDPAASVVAVAVNDKVPTTTMTGVAQAPFESHNL